MIVEKYSNSRILIKYKSVRMVSTYLKIVAGISIKYTFEITEYLMSRHKRKKSNNKKRYILLDMSKKRPQIIKNTNIVFDSLTNSSDSDQLLDYPEQTYLPILFKPDRGKERMWKIWIVGDTYFRLQGFVTGKKQTYERQCTSKQKGKIIPEQQAIKEASSKWAKQIDKGYLPKCKEGKAMLKNLKKEQTKSGGHNINSRSALQGSKRKNITKVNNFAITTVEKVITPMKASVWELDDKSNPKSVKKKVLKYFDFEKESVYLQTKLDGWRCVARLQKGLGGKVDVVMTTNNKKQYPWFSNLRKEIVEFMKGKEKLYLDGLDGEIYAHRIIQKDGVVLDDHARFSTISSMCGIARKIPHPLESQICLIVFDLVDLSGKYDQDQRFARLKKLFNKGISVKCPHILMCKTKIANFLEEVYEFHDEAAQDGYEGVIVRSRDLKYEQKRSLRMRKYKHFIDKEYQIIDVYKNKGVSDENFSWICEDRENLDKTGKSKTFRAKPMGSREDRVYWYNNFTEYLGMPMTVKFQEYTEEGIPRFPVAVGIRKDQ